MQGVTTKVPGEVFTSPTSLLSSPMASRKKNGSCLQGTKSFFFGGSKAVTQLQPASSTQSVQSGSGTATQVRANVTAKSVWDSILGSVVHKTKSVNQDHVYKGVATIAKKRGSYKSLVKFDLIDAQAAFTDKAAELLGNKIEMQLISVDLDPLTNAPQLSAKSTVQGWLTNLGDVDLVADEDFYAINFTVPAGFGEPGGVIISNRHPNEFFIKSMSLQDTEGHVLEFAMNAWVYPHGKYAKDRVFFTNKDYLPSATPAGLKLYREQELQQIRGDGTGERQNWERIYDYDIYNDLGAPDKNKSFARIPVGGSKEYPYPRRMRTGRGPSKTDPNTEKGLKNSESLPYIPSDEYFLRSKNSTFVAGFIKATVHSLLPSLEQLIKPVDFEGYKDIYDLYKSGLPVKIKDSDLVNSSETPDPAGQAGNMVYLSTLFAAKGDNTDVLNYPVPQVVKVDQTAWSKDEEYGRQALAGLHCGVISRIVIYPPKSALDPKIYGQGTALTEGHILPFLEGLTVAQAIEGKRLFIIDYHDAFLPFMNKVNTNAAGFKGYAPRTIFFHNSSGKLVPVAIELSLPPAQPGGAAANRVFTPADEADNLWDLAKVHASAIDTNYHQVLSHFTYCHAVMEPFIIATNRQLSELHPIHTFLKPLYKDTLSINAAARSSLVNAGGQVESNFTMGEYTFPLAAQAYGAFWQFPTQAINANLVARGMAEPADDSLPGSVKLVIEDYPWAKDGLDIYAALKKWVTKYVDIIYKGSDETVKKDSELQAWWNEIVNVGHGDLKDAPWWPKLDSVKNLVEIVTTIAWIAGPTHAALNFNQYGYAGFPPNKPSCCRKLIPEKGSAEYAKLQKNPEKFMMSMIPSTQNAINMLTVIEVLSTHSVDEEYIGTRNSNNWTSNAKIKEAFREFANDIAKVEELIKLRNVDKSLDNRKGPVQVPYTSFMPTSTSGLTGRGVPNSVSI